MRQSVVILLAGVFLLIGCKKRTEIPGETTRTFNQSLMLKDISNTTVLPHLDVLKQKAMDFHTAANSFLTDTSVAQLEVLKQMFPSYYAQYAGMEIFNVGPVKGRYIYELMDIWPIDTTTLYASIDQASLISAASWSKTAYTNRGFNALDALLFSKTVKPIGVSTSPQVRNLIHLISTELLNWTTEIEKEWKENGYKTTFYTHTGTSTDAPLAQLVNGIIQSLENMKFQEIYGPLKSEQGKPNKALARAFHSHSSLPLMKAQLQVIADVFTGNGKIGLQHALQALEAKKNNEPLEKVIQSQIAIVQGLLATMQQPLEVMIYQSPEQVQQLHDEMKTLLILFKIDVASQLSIAVTFSDNDGD